MVFFIKDEPTSVVGRYKDATLFDALVFIVLFFNKDKHPHTGIENEHFPLGELFKLST